jgi:hypothetical protein
VEFSAMGLVTDRTDFLFAVRGKTGLIVGMEDIHGSASFFVSTPEVDFAVSEQGGHLAPVDFYFDEYAVSPYALAPWQPEECDQELPHLLRVLRGDFFCLPFSEQKQGPPHGEPANEKWSLVEQGERKLVLEIVTADSGATVRKSIEVREGQQAVYVEHLVSGLAGRWNYGNHPILDLSELAEGQGRLAVSPFRWASVFDGVFANPATGETGRLKEGARFESLERVPCADGSTHDLTKYPSAPGHEDLVMMVNEPATAEQPFAWTAVTFDDYVWFSLKNTRDFPSTLFWLSNGGRTAHPWEKRHIGRVGLEEVCSYFCYGVDVSREDRLAGEGIATTRDFAVNEVVRLPIIQGVALVEAGFGQVRSILPRGEHSIEITGDQGQVVIVKIDWQFVL